MAHWHYILWGLGGPVSFAAVCRYIPRTILMLVGGLTTNQQRSNQCAEMVRLSRKDAKELPSYLLESSESAELPPATVTQLGLENSPLPPANDGGPRPHTHAS
jgi:hypothetical protein